MSRKLPDLAAREFSYSDGSGNYFAYLPLSCLVKSG